MKLVPHIAMWSIVVVLILGVWWLTMHKPDEAQHKPIKPQYSGLEEVPSVHSTLTGSPTIQDVSSVIAALVTMCDQVAPDPTRQPVAVVDDRGWIDVWELKRDVSQVERMPRDYSDGCTREGDGEEAEVMRELSAEEKKILEERQRKDESAQKACYEENARAGAEFDRAYAALNDAWLPALKEAMKKGDPVAEVILRTCSTSNVIDRKGIESDCSRDEGDKEIARQRLEAIGFAPALSLLNNEDMRRMLYHRQRPKPARPWKGQGPHSDTPTIALGERMIDAMEKGDLSAGSGTGGYFCGNEREKESLYKRCNYLYHMAASIPAEAKWFFIAGRLSEDYSGSLTTLALYRFRANPEQPFRIMYEEQYPNNLSHVGIEGKDNTEFQKEHKARLEKLNTSVATYLKKEPRWAVFLMERNRSVLRFAVPRTEKCEWPQQ